MKKYVVRVAGQAEYRHNSLKAARDLVRSILNVNAVKGISETIEIYKEITRLKKIDEVVSSSDNFGTADKLINL